MTRRPSNIQRIPLRLFIPWDENGRIYLIPLRLFIPRDENGRIYLSEHEFITKDTEIKGSSKIIMLEDGIFIKARGKPTLPKEPPTSVGTKPQSLKDIEAEFAMKYQDATIVYGEHAPELDTLDKEFKEKYQAALEAELRKLTSDWKA